MVYTHNWALFLCVGLAVATAVVVRERLGLFAIVAAAVVVLYLPWLPSLLFQVRHTGAPWATVPSWRDLIVAPCGRADGRRAIRRVRARGRRRAWRALVRGRAEPGADRDRCAHLRSIGRHHPQPRGSSSQFSPSWTTRYFAVVVGPLLVLAARGVVRAGRFGVAALVIVVFFWAGFTVKDDKENARAIAAGIGSAPPG